MSDRLPCDTREEAVEAALAECDAEIAETIRVVSEKWLDMGYRPDELPVLLRPIRAELAALRARHVARLTALSDDAPPALH